MSDDHPNRRAFLNQSAGCVVLTMAALASLPGLSDWPVFGVEAAVIAGERRYPVPGFDSVNIDKPAQLVLVRYQGKVFAMSLVCPHQHAAVRWIDNEKRFECTKHHSKYQEDGTYISGRATRNLDRFPVRLDGSTVVADASPVWQADKNPPNGRGRRLASDRVRRSLSGEVAAQNRNRKPPAA